MATADTRAGYVVLSNTVMGIAMLIGGLVGVLADAYSTQVVVLLLAIISLLATAWNWWLPEVTA